MVNYEPNEDIPDDRVKIVAPEEIDDVMDRIDEEDVVCSGSGEDIEEFFGFVSVEDPVEFDKVNFYTLFAHFVVFVLF